jgi:hypothetical protein
VGGRGLASFVARAVQRYATAANDEEWMTLLGLLNRSADPGATCVRRALAYALQDAA